MYKNLSHSKLFSKIILMRLQRLNFNQMHTFIAEKLSFNELYFQIDAINDWKYEFQAIEKKIHGNFSGFFFLIVLNTCEIADYELVIVNTKWQL